MLLLSALLMYMAAIFKSLTLRMLLIKPWYGMRLIEFCRLMVIVDCSTLKAN